jgi:preprotein translocase subunit SecF
MELFKNTHYDFLGKKWPFIIASLILTVAGLGSIAARGGLNYGIDFKGGALMTVKFASTPQLEKIRAAFSHSPQIKGEVSVQTITDLQTQNEVEIGTELPEEGELNLNRAAMEQVLLTTFGQPGSGKLDLNNTGQGALANRLRDPLSLAGIGMNEQQLQTLAANIETYNKEHSGLIGGLS